MVHRFVAATVLCAAALAAQAQEQDYSKVEIKATKVAGSVYMFEGAGGNIGASVGADGIALVDDEFAPLYGKITEALKGLNVTTKPVRFVMLTHYHFDHTSGNLPFAEAGATVIAHDNLRVSLANEGMAGNGGSMKMAHQPVDSGALPLLTFSDQLTVHMNGEDIRAQHFAGAHTSGDSIVFYPNAHVVHMGDVFVRYGFPFIDVDTGGSVQGMIAACEATLARVPADAKIIPGHGALASVEDLRTYLRLLKDTSAVVRKAIKAGKTLEQMKQANLLGAWSEKYSGKFVNTDGFLESLYYSLRKTGPAAAKHG